MSRLVKREVRNLDWYREQKNKEDCVDAPKGTIDIYNCLLIFTPQHAQHCGKVIDIDHYGYAEGLLWAEWMFEPLEEYYVSFMPLNAFNTALSIEKFGVQGSVLTILEDIRSYGNNLRSNGDGEYELENDYNEILFSLLITHLKNLFI